MRRPSRSADTAHVNPNPDPACLHDFAAGEAKTFGYDKDGNIFCRFRVVTIGHDYVAGELWVRGLTPTPIPGDLDLNHSVVALRLPDGQPALTLTLRKIEGDRAFIQVTAHASIPQKPRTAA